MSPLARNRFFLVASLAVLGLAVGVTAAILSPDGLVRARSDTWGPRHWGAPQSDVVGYAADRKGGECGLARVAGDRIEQRPIPRCHAYQAPEVVHVGNRTLVVWEEADRTIAVSTVGSDLGIGRTLRLPRPTTHGGALLPRIGIGVGRDRLAIRYPRGHIVTVSSDLAAWPGGMMEVASARIGPRGGTVLGGLIGLLVFYFVASSWTLALPRILRRHRRESRCLTLTLPQRGSSLVLEGRAFALDFSGAWFFGLDPIEARGVDVTLVLPEPISEPRGDAYREREELRPLQVWAGDFGEVLRRARAIRNGTLALAAAATALLLLMLDGYLVL